MAATTEPVPVPEKTTKFHILKKLQLEGKTYNRGDQPSLVLPDELRDSLVNSGTIRAAKPEAQTEETADKKAK